MCYRDARTNGILARLFERVSEAEIFAGTGVQTMQINTLFQLCSMVLAEEPKLECAETLLMIPDLFSYWLGGEKAVEYTEATTTQMYLPTRGLGPGDAARVEHSGADSAWGGFAGDGAGRGWARCAGGVWFWEDVSGGCGGVARYGQRGGVDPESGCGQRIYQQRHVEFDGRGARCACDQRAGEGTGLYQRGRMRWEDTADAEYDGAVDPAGVPTAVGEGGSRLRLGRVDRGGRAAEPFRSLIHPNAAEFAAPGNMPEVMRAYCKASGQPVPETVGAIARCCFESLSLAYWSALEALRALTGREIRTIRVVGGGCLNTFLCQMTADACGCNVVSGPAEASALGNVMLQAVAVGELPDVAAGRAAIGESLELIEYAPQRSDGWAEAQARYRRIEAGVE